MMPFENIRVADFTTMLAGPNITRILADLGADVIKVETPEGDTWRPSYGSFIACNRGKRGIAMDLTKPEARPIVHKLISSCQVLVENSRPGIMKKLGIEYETVKQIRPDIIYISSTAFGTKGPDSQRPGYDPIFQSLSGQMAGQGGIDAPIYHKISLNDEFTPLIGAFGCACALFNKMRTGQGQMVETSLLSTAAFVQSGRFIKYKGMKRRQTGKPDKLGISATNRLYQGVNGEWFYLYCVNEEHFQTVCRLLGLEKLITDTRFATEGARKRHEKQLSVILQDAFMNAPANIQAFLLILAGVPAAYAQKSGQLFEDAHCKETGVFTTIQDPDYGEVLIQDVTTKFSKTPGKIQRPCPMHGQHTTEVLLEIGYSTEQIEEFKAKKLVMQSAR
ncbi:MAG: CoA transferase [Chloroflexi bacterium]|nr:CoA transferase [Chloroflexota bacterium]